VDFWASTSACWRRGSTHDGLAGFDVVSGLRQHLREIAVHLGHEGDRTPGFDGGNVVGALLHGSQGHLLRLHGQRLHAAASAVSGCLQPMEKIAMQERRMLENI
jgi:hypothetical protein